MIDRRAGSLYVCGSPGTGKSALMHIIRGHIHKWERQRKLPKSRIIAVNAMLLSKPNTIYPTLLRELKLITEGKSANSTS